MTTSNRLLKTPTEAFSVDMNFGNDLSSGESISTQTTTVTRLSDNLVVTNIISTESISNPKVVLKLQNGLVGEVFNIRTTVITNNANTLTISVDLAIESESNDYITKDASEEFLVKVSFEDMLGSDTLTSQAVTSLDVMTGLDNTSEFISGSAISESIGVLVKIKAGILRNTVEVTVQATTTSGNTFEKIFLVYIRNE